MNTIFVFIVTTTLLLLKGCSCRWSHLPEKCGKNIYSKDQHKPRKHGKTTISRRSMIVGGDGALLGQVPWMVRIGRIRNGEEFFFCGGTLINRYYVVTAAHCLEQDFNTVRLGENDVKTEIDCDNYVCAPPVQDIAVKEFIDANYSYITDENDIALIELKTPAKFNDFVQPACIPKGRIIRTCFQGNDVIVAGWGLTQVYPRTLPEILKFILSPIVNEQECNSLFKHKLVKGQMCLGFSKGKDSCSGDSGGGAFVEMKEKGETRSYLIGIVSYGLKKCGEGPGVYTDVTYYLDWILSQITHG